MLIPPIPNPATVDMESIESGSVLVPIGSVV